MNNFTWRYDKEPSGKWGTTPKTGTWADPNATFEGIVLVVVLKCPSVLIACFRGLWEDNIW